MNYALHDTLQTFYRTDNFLKYNRKNYIPCYKAFENFCSIRGYDNYTLSQLFKNILSKDNIVQACKLYIMSYNNTC